jgi:hypothetical protein
VRGRNAERGRAPDASTAGGARGNGPADPTGLSCTSLYACSSAQCTGRAEEAATVPTRRQTHASGYGKLNLGNWNFDTWLI